MLIRKALFTAAACLATLVVPRAAMACGCAPVPGRPVVAPLIEVQSQLAQSDQVFLGRVSARSESGLVFEVEAYWKGQGTRQLLFAGDQVLPDGSVVVSDCQFSFENDVLYVVFAGHTPRGLSASSCGLSRRADQADALLQLLDRAAPRQVVPPRGNVWAVPPNQRMQPAAVNTEASLGIAAPRLMRGR